MRPQQRPRSAAGAAPAVPGYRLEDPLGVGATGTVWAGRDRAGRPVAVAVLPPAAGERVEARERRLAALVALDHPHVAGVVDVVGMGEACAVVSERVDGPTLAAVRASRTPLGRSEAAGVLAAIAGALGHLHARGVVHGDVSPANVVLAPGRGPVLVDLAGDVAIETGTPGFAAPERARGRPAAASGDVWSLATTVSWLVAPAEREAVREVLAPALADRPEARCDAGALAGLAEALGPARPVELPGSAALAQGALRAGAALVPTTRARARRPRRRGASPAARAGSRRRVAFGPRRRPVPRRPPRPSGLRGPRGNGPRRARWRDATALVVGVLVGVGLLRAALPPGATPTDDGAGFEEVVTDLVAARDAALVAADPARLAGLTVPGSDAASVDAATAAELARRDVRLTGLRTTVHTVEVLEAGRDVARLGVVTSQAAYERRVGAAAVEGVPAQPRRCDVLTLRHHDGRWRVDAVAPCPATGRPTPPRPPPSGAGA